MNNSTTNGLAGEFSSHDHILKIQKMTGGLVLVAGHKMPSIADLRFFNDVSGGKPRLYRYFINCVFPSSILSEDHRFSEYSINPGNRHDITLDLEKKWKDPSGKFVKDKRITDDEKNELIDALQKLDFVGWAGPTPHGVHCGIYFDDWTQIAHSRCIIAWFQNELKHVAGYKGPLVIDLPPSVNCNRPSRFLDKFSFFRPGAQLDVGPVIAQNFKMPDLFESLSPGMEDMKDRENALRCRANMMDREETAVMVGKTPQWVQTVWDSVKQTATNPFNQYIGSIVGPKTKAGLKKLSNATKIRLYRNAGWSWQVCWDQKMDLPAAIEYVFSNPEYEELLCLLEQALTESRQLNQGVRKYATLREWVEGDLERCWEKFGRGEFVSKMKRDAIKAAIIQLCIRSGKSTVKMKEVEIEAGNLSHVTVRKAFVHLGVIGSGNTKGRVFEVPPELLPSSQPSKDVTKAASPLPSPQSLCAVAINPIKSGKSIMELTFESFWKGLVPDLTGILMNPCLVPDHDLDRLKSILRPHLKANPDWKNLLYRSDSELKYGHGLKDDLLDIVRRCLSWDGHVVQEPDLLLKVLKVILGSRRQQYYQWLLLEGYIAPVQQLAGTVKDSVAWRYNLLGEARFAWRFVEHCWRGGRVEMIYGEPGTGKTEELAKKLIAAGAKGVGGSAQHASAGLLEQRIKDLGGNQPIKTVYKGYKFFPNDLHKTFDTIKRKLFFVDEFGQVSCDAAGIIALRWKPGSTALLSLGPKQNMPVGPGRVGEDLLEWLLIHPNVLPTCQLSPLIENHRLKNEDSKGIVQCFQAVGRGEIPQSGPGMEIIYCDDERDVVTKVVEIGRRLKAMCVLPTNASTNAVSDGIIAGDRYDYEMDFADTNYRAGEKLIMINASQNAKAHNLRNGIEVEVAEYAIRIGGPNAKITVWGTKGTKVELELSEVGRKNARTGHAIQGIEHPMVVVGIVTSRAANNRWLYTAVSRSREQCVLVCTKDGLKECVEKRPARKTLLPVLLDRALLAFKSMPDLEPIKKPTSRKPRKQKEKLELVASP